MRRFSAELGSLSTGPKNPGLLNWFCTAKRISIAAMLMCLPTVSPAQSVSITEYALPTANSGTYGIAAGPDSALWFTEDLRNKIGRITTAGVITEYPVPTYNSGPYAIAAGPDNALWFTEYNGNKIGRITTAGVITEYAVPTAYSLAIAIAAGPDNALWFLEYTAGKIGRITTAGVITEYAVPTANSGLYGIAAGPDSALWFTESYNSKIGRITTAGVITEYALPPPFSTPFDITAGPDGALWFTDPASNQIGRITTTGVITGYAVPTYNSGKSRIIAGPDNALWFSEYNANKIGRITKAGVITEYPVPTYNSGLAGITAGPDGALWFTENLGNAIGRAAVITANQTPPITVPRSIASGIALSAAGGYRVSHDNSWHDYEDIVVIVTLNEVAKLAANTGKSMLTSDYNAIANQARSWLDGRPPKNQTILTDQVAALHYAIDTLAQLNNLGASAPIFAASLGNLERTKFRQFESPLNTNLQTPSDPALYSVEIQAHQFIVDSVQEAADLAQNDTQYAAAINPVLKDLTGLDTSNSYLDVEKLYPNAIPNLTVNADGSLTVSSQDLTNEYGLTVSSIQSATDGMLANLPGAHPVRMTSLVTLAANCSFSINPTSSSQTAGGGGGSVNVVAPTGCTWVAAPVQGDGDSWITVTSGNTGSGNGTVVFTVAPNLGMAGRSGVITIAGLSFVVSQGALGGVTNGPCSDQSQMPPCWKDSQSAVDGYSKVFGFIGYLTSDPTLTQFASQISAVGTATIQVGQAVEAIQSIISGSFQLGSIGAIIGAGQAIFNLFGGAQQQPNPNAVVLQQIQKLSQQMVSLQQNMNNQFAQVNKQLNTMLMTLNNDFQLIDFRLGVINGNVQIVETGLFNVESQLNQMEQYTLQYFQASTKSQLISEMNGCLNYATIHNGADIGSGLYSNCENDFYTWAHDDSSNAIWDLQPTNYSDGNIYNFFEMSPNIDACPTGCPAPFAVDVNYLAQFPAMNPGMHLPPLSTATALANPNEWTLGARAYLELAHEWPQYAVNINSSRLDYLVQVGSTLQQAVQSANSVQNGGSILPNYSLFSGLVAKYAAATPGLQSAMQNEADSFVSGLLNGAPTYGFNLWGGTNQSQTYTYVPAGVQSSTPAFGAPADLTFYGNIILGPAPGLSALIPNPIKLIDQLGIAKLNLWYTVIDPVNGGICSPGSALGQDSCYWMPPFVTNASCSAGQGVPRAIRIIGMMASGSANAPAGNVVFDQSGWFCAQGTDNNYTGDQCSNNDTSNCYQKTLQDWQGNVNGARSSWIANSAPVTWGGAQNNVYAWLSYWSGILTSVLQSYQGNYYALLASTNANNGNVIAAGQPLDGTRLLLQAYTNFGLPVSIASNSTLQAQLYGNQAIFDSTAVQADFLNFSTSVTNITDNKVTDEISAMNSRITALSSTINAALSLVQTTQKAESMSQVDVTLADLRSFEALKNAGAITPCDYHLSSSSAAADPGGGPISVGLQVVVPAVGPPCTWTATTGASWLTVTSGQKGSGPATVGLTASPNGSGSTRVGIVIIGDQVYKVFQGVPVAPSGPTVVSAVPASGSGSAQTFAGTVTDGAGFSAISTVYLLINSTLSAVTGCEIEFNRAANTLRLMNDAGTTWLGPVTVGSAASLANSQCTVSAASAFSSASGTNLTINVPLSFAFTFSGAKNTFVFAYDNAGQGSGWLTKGTWTVPSSGPPAVVSTLPGSGPGSAQTFALTVADGAGPPNISVAYLLINSSFSGVNGCQIEFNRAANTFRLLNDAGSGWLGPITLGTATSLANSQCTISGNGASSVPAGNNLTINIPTSFAFAFSGAKSTFAFVYDNAFTGSGWVNTGSWTVPSSGPPAVVATLPASGSGAAQTFSLTVADGAGPANISLAYLLINSSFSGAGGCYVEFNQAANTFRLQNDAGSGWLGPITLGTAASLANSQCTISGNGASSVTAGNNLTINIPTSFAFAFSGAKSTFGFVYDNAFTGSGWFNTGSWTVPSSGLPAVVAALPASGSGAAQTFSLTVADGAGAANISLAYLLINSSFSGVGGCYVEFNRAANTFRLQNDAGSGWLGPITLGTAASLANSQCTISGNGASSVTAGDDLTINIPTSFAFGFNGAKSTLGFVYDNAFTGSGWFNTGSWTVPSSGPPAVVAALPASGSGSAQTFTLNVADGAGAANISLAYLLINSSFSGVGGCYVEFNRAANTFRLQNDAGSGWLGPITLGTATSLANSQCTISGNGASSVTAGNDLTINIPTSFAFAFNGAKSTFGFVYDNAFTGSGWVNTGSWTVPSSGLPAVVAALPASGSGSAQTFSLTVADGAGAANISLAYLLINSSFSGVGGCYVEFNRAANTFRLQNDAGSGWLGPITLGTAASLANSQCTISGNGASSVTAGNDLTINIPTSFAFAFSGAKSTFGFVYDNAFTGSGWVNTGSWTVPGSGPPAVVAVLPASGSGAAQTFSLTVADGAGTANINLAYLLMNSSFSGVNACYVEFNRAANTFRLQNDAGTGWLGPITLGSGSSLVNSQCTVSAAAASFSTSGTDLTVNIPVTFTAGFAGLKSVFGFAYDNAFTGSGWVTTGSWNP
jgi:streptogramin lyase